MTQRSFFLCPLAVACAFILGCKDQSQSPSNNGLPIVVIQTSIGDISVELDSVNAPQTAANFLRYVDDRLYDGGSFFRTVHADNQPRDSIRIAVVQGGADNALDDRFFDPIELERTSITGLKHLNGTISMARGGPNSATHSFFFCIGDQPELDFGGRRNPDGQGFAAFGIVIEGSEVLRQIQMSPHAEQRLEPPISILSIRRR